MFESKPTATGVWKSFLLSFLLPVVGGLIVYFRNKDRDRELIYICLILSVFHPFMISFFVSTRIVYIIISLILTIILMRVYNKNRYRYFIPVWYFSLLGAVYSYFYGYKEDKSLRNDLGWFLLTQLLAGIILTMTVSGIYYVFISYKFNSY